MATQFKDGSFSETKAFVEALEDFQEYAAAGRARALFVGTEEEIEAAKKKQNTVQKLEELEGRISAMEAEKKLGARGIVIPTPQEINKVTENHAV